VPDDEVVSMASDERAASLLLGAAAADFANAGAAESISIFTAPPALMAAGWMSVLPLCHSGSVCAASR